MSKIRLFSLAMVISLGLCGCYSTAQMAPSQLSKLDGVTLEQLDNLRSQDVVTLVDKDGDSFTVSDLEISFSLCCGHPKTQARGRFKLVEIRDEAFVGITRRGERVEIPLSQISEFRMAMPSTGKTLALVGAIAGVIAVVLFFKALGDATSSSN